MRETIGAGVEGVIDGRAVKVGSHQMVHGARQPEPWAVRALRRAAWRSALSVFVAVDGRIDRRHIARDALRRETPRAVQTLRAAGVSRIVMVTGDRADAAETIGAALDLDAVLADREPADKVEAVATEQRQNPTVMVGDGINDAPALAAATVGIAMGARGASASSRGRRCRHSDRPARPRVRCPCNRTAHTPHRPAEHHRRTGLVRRRHGLCGDWFASAHRGRSDAGGDRRRGHSQRIARVEARPAMGHRTMPASAATMLRSGHEKMESALDRLREIADSLDIATGTEAVGLISEADRIVRDQVIVHEREDENAIYPRVAAYLADRHGLGAMSRAHREIIHLARLLRRLADGLTPQDADLYVIRDAQRVIELIDALVRLHNAQEEDIYEYAIGA